MQSFLAQASKEAQVPLWYQLPPDLPGARSQDVKVAIRPKSRPQIHHSEDLSKNSIPGRTSPLGKQQANRGILGGHAELVNSVYSIQYSI